MAEPSSSSEVGTSAQTATPRIVAQTRDRWLNGTTTQGGASDTERVHQNCAIPFASASLHVAGEELGQTTNNPNNRRRTKIGCSSTAQRVTGITELDWEPARQFEFAGGWIS